MDEDGDFQVRVVERDDNGNAYVILNDNTNRKSWGGEWVYIGSQTEIGDPKIKTARVRLENNKLQRKQNERIKEKSDKINFRSAHWDEPNILVHLRMNTRTDAEGRKVLFVEEIQSDWGQKGKKEGFEQGDKTYKISDFRKEKQQDGSWVVYGRSAK